MAETAHAQQPARTARTQEQPPATKARVLQRKCACGGCTSGVGECENCRKKRLGIQRKPAATGPVTRHPADLSHVDPILASPGRPLGADTQTLMAARFGRSFSEVRIHTDGAAAASADAVNALAYTVGQHIVFGAGQFSPATPSGQHLLAHELTHTVQQGHGDRAAMQRLAISPENSPLEREADAAADAALADQSMPATSLATFTGLQRQPKTPELTNAAAGGCGICYSGDVRAIGNDAHTQIQLEFEIMYPNLLTQFPIELPKSDYIISKGIPDLILPTPTGFKIGEIKPANPEGYIEGDAKVEIYRKLLTEKYGKINPNLTLEPLDVAPPAPFVYLEPAASTCKQFLFVNPSVRGVYGYFCDPPFSAALRRACQCDKEPKPLPQKQEQKQESDEKSKKKAPDTRDEPLIPAPKPEVLVPIAITALAAAAMAWAAKKGLGRAAAPALVLMAIVLVANGAEASVGLEGDDVIDAMFKLAEQKGTPVPDDLKQAIKKDPALRKILEDAGKSGNGTEAQRKLGEQLTRIILENRDQFTEEEINELLQVTEANSGALPNGPVTAEVLRRALEAKRAGVSGKGGGGSGSDAPAADTTPKTDEPPSTASPTAGLPPPAKRLADALLSGAGKGPKVDAAGVKRLRDILTSTDPPLTEAEADALIKKIGSAEGKTLDEVLNALQRGIAGVRTPADVGQPAGDAGSGDAGDPAKTTAAADAAGKDQDAAGNGTPGAPAGAQAADTKKPAGTPGPQASVKDAVKKAPPSGGKEHKQLADTLKSKFDWIQPGELFIFGEKDLVFTEGLKFKASIAGRDEKNNKLFFGTGTVTVRKVGGSWELLVPAGITLYDATGVYGSSKKIVAPALAGAGTGAK